VSAWLPALLAVVAGCSLPYSSGSSTGAETTGSAAAQQPSSGEEPPILPYDVRPLLSPQRDYVGLALPGAPTSMVGVNDFAARTGKRPNLLLFYAGWGHGYDITGVRNAWASGALPFVAWEPFEPSLAEIADGATDDYIRSFAEAVRTVNVPVAISFGHEMNGDWFPWGTASTSAADFVRAWRHVHDLFVDVGATNVIWVWNPNVVNPVPDVELQPLYPGDTYVDWIGLSGYYTRSGAFTFPTLFGPTLDAVHRFTAKPVLIAETGAMPGARKASDVADLLDAVAADSTVIGAVWFEYNKEVDWRLSSDPAALAEYTRQVAEPSFGFDAREP
jgi:mannan endo-1,4-beta-mannosidase